MIADLVETFIDADRADSMRARTFQEDEMGAKAAQRLAFGWGGHNRFRVFDEYGEATTPIDALWMIQDPTVATEWILPLCRAGVIALLRA